MPRARTAVTPLVFFLSLIMLYGCQEDPHHSIRRAYSFLDFTTQRSSAFWQVSEQPSPLCRTWWRCSNVGQAPA